jgi:hypothetical protein
MVFIPGIHAFENIRLLPQNYEVLVLVLLMGGMYEVPIGMASHGMMLLCIPSFMMIG